MNTKADVCAACGKPLASNAADAAKLDQSVTTVREGDHTVILVHCPRCATLHVRVREATVAAAR